MGVQKSKLFFLSFLLQGRYIERGAGKEGRVIFMPWPGTWVGQEEEEGGQSSSKKKTKRELRRAVLCCFHSVDLSREAVVTFGPGWSQCTIPLTT